MSFLPAFMYVSGLAVFGFLYWILDAIKISFETVSTTGDVYNLVNYIWTGIIIIYIIFGGVWVVRKYNEKQYREGGF